ncbi:Putative zinc-finger [Sporobacter termitidis DSM 10068]|uniref:Anti-sigma-W factor RsiW n=1 Tax=Sporobacter termitidis DSM 10068 TaxID=1123282 RepID=A0A1M5VC03_9FIRM|nr:zf-HC2 domain-containing protein [Sporobacter termitidis]SHH72453.1 Putative zinc-finger [Sporobacter termitidis DSM 10068]
MAECKKYMDLISGFADGELADGEKAGLERHLAECPECQALLSAYRSISEAAEEAMEEPPEELAGLVMARIMALPEGAAAESGRRTRKTIMPVIISFVAAAACLALVFIVKPQLFGFSGSSGAAPNAAAPEAAAVSPPALSDAGEDQYAQMKIAPAGQADATDDYGAESTQDTEGSAASPTQTAAGSAEKSTGTATATAAGTAGSTTASPEPSIEPHLMLGAVQSTEADTVKLEKYYAVITIKGQLPDILQAEQQTDNGDGTFNIEVSVQTAEQLISEKYEAVLGSGDATTALVVYTPAS